MMCWPMWKKHCNMFKEHIYYIMNYIQKPFNMVILKYAKHVHDMFEMKKLLPLNSRKNEKYDEANWDTRDMPYKYDVIHK